MSSSKHQDSWIDRDSEKKVGAGLLASQTSLELLYLYWLSMMSNKQTHVQFRAKIFLANLVWDPALSKTTWRQEE